MSTQTEESLHTKTLTFINLTIKVLSFVSGYITVRVVFLNKVHKPLILRVLLLKGIYIVINETKFFT